MNKPLVIFEMANNHMGDVKHGLLMIDKFSSVAKKYGDCFEFGLKFQFRDLASFIHGDYKNKTDHKYVKRFTETALTVEQFEQLKRSAEDSGFKTLCTGFDEPSVDLIEQMGFDIIKVASCSSTDWPLLNRISLLNKPIIISTAGTTFEDIDRVVSFMQHRGKDISLMHCVGEYPTKYINFQMNQIDLFKERYPNVRIGFSTHEEPTEYDSAQIAIAKGVTLIEKHIAVETDQYAPNAYSATPEQMDKWLSCAQKALKMCGVDDRRSEFSEKELKDLMQFRRGMFAKKKIRSGDTIKREDVYFAWPAKEYQVLASDASKYNVFTSLQDIEPNAAVMFRDVVITNTREKIKNIAVRVKDFIAKTGVVVPGEAELEISHHYGLDKFEEIGLTMITVVNREYCKKLLILFPNQKHPEQYHLQKEETFVVLHGEMELTLDGIKRTLKNGDVVTVERGVRHEFTTKTGCIVEEVSSTHFKDDSFYTDETIANNKNRKTFVTYWL
jgi:sialic acid synthase SpsE/mannose-6-phosphate isomerase-like protein (cupin superfamily)